MHDKNLAVSLRQVISIEVVYSTVLLFKYGQIVKVMAE